MKKLAVIFIAVLMVVLSVSLKSLATGAVGTDIPQSGAITFTATTTTYVTNSFAYQYSVVPVMRYSVVTTNAAPITNIFITTSNYAFSVPTTNSTIQWNSYVPYWRIQSGSNGVQALQFITNTFTSAFVSNPIVTIADSSTNVVGGEVAVLFVTPSNFCISFGNNNTNCVVQWQALGPAYTPGNNVVTY